MARQCDSYSCGIVLSIVVYVYGSSQLGDKLTVFPLLSDEASKC